MVTACKILKIEMSDLVPKKLDEFVKRQHDLYYEQGGDEAVKRANINGLAKLDFDHYEKRRILKT